MNKGRFVAVLSAFAALFLAGCKTGPAVLPDNPFNILGSGASYYLVLPVDANRDLLKQLAASQTNSDSLLQAVDRTSVIYAGLYKAADNAADMSAAASGTVRLAATGFFPRMASPAVFAKTKGWKKIVGESGASWYKNGAYEASIPKNGLVCLSSGGGIETILKNIETPLPVSLSPAFIEYASAAAVDGRIGIFVSDTQALAARLLGPEITLPVSYAEIFAERVVASPVPRTVQNAAAGDAQSDAQSAGSTENTYDISAHIVLTDARTARSIKTLISLLLSAEVRIEGEQIYVSSYNVTAEKLVEIARILYLDKNDNKE